MLDAGGRGGSDSREGSVIKCYALELRFAARPGNEFFQLQLWSVYRLRLKNTASEEHSFGAPASNQRRLEAEQARGGAQNRTSREIGCYHVLAEYEI